MEEKKRGIGGRAKTKKTRRDEDRNRGIHKKREARRRKKTSHCIKLAFVHVEDG